MGMGKKPVDTLEVKMTSEMMQEIIEAAVRRVPVLEKASVLTSWAGIRPMTPDDRPIIGPVPSVEGMILNCGWGGTGIIQAPIAGQLVAEFIRNGHTTTLDTSSLGINRFGKTSGE
jgi:glycine/D-amino acid oxidase-like deaminating enzyme